ncbi:MAG TPA: oligosaccharide flippase family protein, partial [Caldilineaceae bacterium]|nr:oligosaccharide flippase family protein [Caldilineaceae bacterium]
MLTKPLNIVGTLILARLLDPYDFGLVALSMLLVTSSYLFVDLGMGSALIQTQLERRRVIFPAFIVTMFGGVVLTALIILFAAPLARFLGEPSATATIT